MFRRRNASGVSRRPDGAEGANSRESPEVGSVASCGRSQFGGRLRASGAGPVAIHSVTRAGSGEVACASGTEGRRSDAGGDAIGASSGFSRSEFVGAAAMRCSANRIAGFSGVSAGGSHVRIGTGKMVAGFHGGGATKAVARRDGGWWTGFNWSRNFSSAMRGVASGVLPLTVREGRHAITAVVQMPRSTTLIHGSARRCGVTFFISLRSSVLSQCPLVAGCFGSSPVSAATLPSSSNPTGRRFHPSREKSR